MSSSDPNNVKTPGGYNSSNQGYGVSVGTTIPATAANGLGNVSYTTYTIGAVPGSVTGVGPIEKSALYGMLNTTTDTKPMSWEGLDKGDLSVSFSEVENGILIRAELAPEHDITALEQLRIGALMTVLAATYSTSSFIGTMLPLTYIRRHRLERHFRFRQA